LILTASGYWDKKGIINSEAGGAEGDPEPRKQMTKEDLVDLLRKILGTDADLDFLSDLGQRELETLIACIRGRIEQEKGGPPA
jgi:hypothetical protein